MGTPPHLGWLGRALIRAVRGCTLLVRPVSSSGACVVVRSGGGVRLCGHERKQERGIEREAFAYLPHWAECMLPPVISSFLCCFLFFFTLSPCTFSCIFLFSFLILSHDFHEELFLTRTYLSCTIHT